VEIKANWADTDSACYTAVESKAASSQMVDLQRSPGYVGDTTSHLSFHTKVYRTAYL